MIPKFIDAHVHLNTTSPEKMEKALENNAAFLSINTNIPFFISVEEQGQVILELQKKYPGRVQYITSFDFRDWGETLLCRFGHLADQKRPGQWRCGREDLERCWI